MKSPQSATEPLSKLDATLLWGVRAALGGLLLTPLVVSHGTGVAAVFGKSIYSRSLIEVALALWAILIVRRPEYRPARSWVLLAFSGWVVASLIAAIFGASFQRSIWGDFYRMQGVFELAHWFAAMVLAASVIRGLRAWRIFLNLNLLVGLGVVVISLFEFTGFRIAAFPWLTGPWLIGPYDGRLRASLGNATYVGFYGMVITLLAAGLLADSLGRPIYSPPNGESHRGQTTGFQRFLRRLFMVDDWQPQLLRALQGIGIVGGLWLIAGSGARGAALGLAAGLLFAGVLYALWGVDPKWRRAAKAGVAILCLAIVLFAGLRLTGVFGTVSRLSPLVTRATSPFGVSAEDRVTSVRVGLDAFLHRPVTGYGPQNYIVAWFENLSASDRSTFGSWMDQAHDKPVEVLATTGIVGFAAWAAFWILLIGLNVRQFKAGGKGQRLSVFVSAAAVAYFVDDLFLFDTTVSHLLLAVLVGFTIASNRGFLNFWPRPHRSAFLDVGVVTTAVLVLGFSLYTFQLQPWIATSRLAVNPATVSPRRVEKDLRLFPSMLIEVRRQFLLQLTYDVGRAPADQRNALVAMGRRQIATLVAAEPDNMIYYRDAADFYRAAAKAIPSERAALLSASAHETELALQFGPNTLEAHAGAVEQTLAEGNLEQAEAAVAQWKTFDPAMSASTKAYFDPDLEALRSRVTAGGATSAGSS